MRAVALGQILISYFHTLNTHWVPAVSMRKWPDDCHTRTAYINGAGQSVHILHAHSSFLSSLQRCNYEHDFSVNHMRTTYAHNNLSAQSDQPIAVCCWKTFTFYKLFLVSSSPHWSRSARCDGVCLNLCLLWIFNRDIWNANSNGSGQTALCYLNSKDPDETPHDKTSKMGVLCMKRCCD